MNSMIKDVTDFTNKFGLPISKIVTYPDTDRMALIAEEFDEILIAYARGELVGILDGLVDLVYVIIGTAIQSNLPFEDAWILIHQANMRKERADPNDHHQGIIKPEGWISPNPSIEELIRRAIDES